MPAADPSTVTAFYKRGLALGRAGAFFEAHEAFETAWRTCEHDERDLRDGPRRGVDVQAKPHERRRGKYEGGRWPPPGRGDVR